MESRNLRLAFERYLFLNGEQQRASDSIVFVDRSVEWTWSDRFKYRFWKLNPIIERAVIANRGEIRSSGKNLGSSDFIVAERYDAKGNPRFPQLIVPKYGPPRVRHDRKIPATSYSRFYPAEEIDLVDQILDDLQIGGLIRYWSRRA